MTNQPSFTEHRVPRDHGSIYVRDYAGTGPAFVLMHGFPDNLHIYDYLIPQLVARGRRVVAFDFLGFGESDKPAGATYSFGQQLGDLKAVVDALGLEKIIPVAHPPVCEPNSDRSPAVCAEYHPPVSACKIPFPELHNGSGWTETAGMASASCRRQRGSAEFGLNRLSQPHCAPLLGPEHWQVG